MFHVLPDKSTVCELSDMIVNRTASFRKIRTKDPDISDILSVDNIRNAMEDIHVGILELKKRLARNALPSFKSREKKRTEINDQKSAIENLVEDVKSMINGFQIEEQAIRTSIQNYFLMMLKRFIILYRNIQQEEGKRPLAYIEYIPDYRIYNEHQMMQETTERAVEIRQSVFNLTNTLLELKLALKTQTMMIDRIDFYFDKSNLYLEEANKEIQKMPGYLTGYKDVLIYILIYIAGALMILLLVKLSRERREP